MEELQKRTEQKHTEQAHQKELRIQKQITQLDTTIQDLEDMIHADLSYNVSVNYYERPQMYPNGQTHPYGIGIKKHKPSFDIIKEQNLNTLLPVEQRKEYYRFTLAKHYGDNEELDGAPRYGGIHNKKLTDMVPFGIAETSDKFVAILNIVKQQDARIEEFERMFLVMSNTIEKMSTTIEKLERIICDKDDSVVEAVVNEESPVEETNDELTSESDSEWGLIVNTQ